MFPGFPAPPPAKPAAKAASKPAPSREVLAEQDADAWQEYGHACNNPIVTEPERAEAWDRAIDAFEALFEHDRPLKP